ncbi:MAG: DUF4142 domain-containing protein [Gemmatimonadales bacterium]
MRMHLPVALLLLAPWAAVAAGQDSTQARYPAQDSTKQQTNDRWSQDQSPQSDDAILMKMHRSNQMEIRLGRLAARSGSSAKVKAFGNRLVRDHSAADQKVAALAKKLGITLARGGWMMDSTRDHGLDGRRGHARQGNDSSGRARWSQRSDSTQRNRNDSTDQNQSYQGRRDSTQGQGQYQQDQSKNQGQYQQGQGQAWGQDSTRRAEMREHMQSEQRLNTLRGAEFDAAFADMMVKDHDKDISMLEQAQGQVQHDELRTLIVNTLPTLRTHLQTAQSLSTSTTTTSSIHQ